MMPIAVPARPPAPAGGVVHGNQPDSLCQGAPARSFPRIPHKCERHGTKSCPISTPLLPCRVAGEMVKRSDLSGRAGYSTEPRTRALIWR